MCSHINKDNFVYYFMWLLFTSATILSEQQQNHDKGIVCWCHSHWGTNVLWAFGVAQWTMRHVLVWRSRVGAIYRIQHTVEWCGVGVLAAVLSDRVQIDHDEDGMLGNPFSRAATGKGFVCHVLALLQLHTWLPTRLPPPPDAAVLLRFDVYNSLSLPVTSLCRVINTDCDQI